MGTPENRLEELIAGLRTLLAAPPFRFDESLRSNLPERPGIYVIQAITATSEEVLRAGRTTGVGGLRQRVYQNHLMGNQSGNLRAQLVRSGRCCDMAEAKSWIRENCLVRFLIVDDDDEIRWAEHFMLAVLRPIFSD